MATTRNYIDLDAAFTANPRTHDVATKTDENAIRGALRNLVYTQHYDRPFQPDLGCQIYSMLFEPLDALSLIVAERVITDVINKYEPRIALQKVSVNEQEDNSLFIQIEYLIKNTLQPQVFTTTFTRIR